MSDYKWSMKVENIKISKLKLFDQNPRRISREQMNKLCRSIESDPDYLQCRPVLVNVDTLEDESGKNSEIFHVYAGNQRIRAAKKLGMKEIPCIISYGLEEKTIKDRMIKDNATYGEWDFDQLANCFDIESLVECGLTEKQLMGIFEDDNEENKKKDEKKGKFCPHCNGAL